MKKFSVVFIVFSMLLHTISLPLHTYAQENYYNMKIENEETGFIDGKVITDKDEEKVPLYECMNHDSEVLAHLYNGDTLKVIENYEEFSLVEIDLKDKNNIDINVNNNDDDDGNSEILQGYIVNNYIDLIKNEKTEKDKESNSTIEDDDDEKNNDKENTDDNSNIDNNENETDNKSNSKSKGQEPPTKNKSEDKNNNDLNNNTDNTETDNPEKEQFKKVNSIKGI